MKTLLAIRSFAIAAALAQMARLSGEEARIPAGGASLISAKGVFAFTAGTGKGMAEISEVTVSGMPFRKALRVRTVARPDVDYRLQAVARTVRAVKRGDVALAIITARAAETPPGTAEARATFVFERAGPGYEKSVTKAMRLRKEWRTYYIPFAIIADYPAGGASCTIRYGYDPQAIELGEVRILNFKRAVSVAALPRTVDPIVYGGMERDAPWRKAAEERIEKYRKGDLSISVVDPEGKPVIGAEVSASMLRHAYHFGAAVTARWLTAEGPDGDRYRAIVEENYNKVVFENDLKIGPWERGKRPVRGSPFSMDATMKALAWCADRGILVRGHTLLWGPLDAKFYPKELGFDVSNGNWKEMGEILMAHLEEKAMATGRYVSEWDVINHPVAKWGDRGRCWDSVLGRGFYVKALERAKELNPNQLLYVNEGSDFPGSDEGVRAAYEKLAADLLAAGAPLDGIGFMSHFDEDTLASMDGAWALLERYARFGLRLQSTELDVGAGYDEAGQADYYRDFMTLFFSHPSTVGIVMWGFWERSHWEPERALYRADWSVKPAGEAWLDLVKGKWWTEASGLADASGSYAIRGFLGEYEVTASSGGKKASKRVSLPKEGTALRIVLGD